MKEIYDLRENLNLMLMNSIETTLTNELADSIMDYVIQIENKAEELIKIK